MKTIHTAGRSVARFPIPIWVKCSHAAAVTALACSSALFVLLLDGWRWVTDESLVHFALVAVIATSVAVVTLVVLVRKKLWLRFFAVELQKNKTSFKGVSYYLAPVAAFGLIFPFMTLSFLVYKLALLSPVPTTVYESTGPRASPPSGGALPIHLWDYALTIPVKLLENYDVLLPYEKGPPEKLLPRIVLVERATNTVVLELHGKRPRKYADHVVDLVFRNPKGTSLLALWQYIPEMVRFSKEAGIFGTQNHSQRGLVLARTILGTGSEAGQTVDAIGTVWPQAEASSSDAAEQRFFYRAADGSVYQVRANDPRLTPVLAGVRFALDPLASRQERKAWTMERIQRLLRRQIRTPSVGNETTLALYLISLLTLDPRDPEAYFHLGKLAHNTETLHSALRYGRDVGLDAAKLAELQTMLDNR